jgi:hypothetical protein
VAKLILILSLLFSSRIFADQVVQGTEVESSIEDLKVDDESPHLYGNKILDNSKMVEGQSPNLPNTINNEIDEVSALSEARSSGYTLPGTMGNKENYTEIDTKHYSEQFRKESTSAFNISYIRDSFNYHSPNDVISRTISSGYKHVQSGFLLLRSDRYIYNNGYFTLHWALGGGLAYNYGRGIFADGERSDAGIALWEVPIDLGLGISISAGKYIKLTGTAGPSLLALIQNRDDLKYSEKGKKRFQTGAGAFASAQVKINLYSFASDSSYELFTNNQITSSYLNIEARYHSYSKYLEDIKISGTSLGAGFTFEFL